MTRTPSYAAEIAAALHVDLRTVKRRIASGAIPSFKVGRARRVSVETLARIIRKGVA